MDLAAEREASRGRREQRERPARLRSRLRACRHAMHGPLHPFATRRRPGSIEEAARELWPNMPDEEVAEIVAAAEESVERGPPVTQLTTQQAKDIARAYLEEHRGASTREIWRHVLKQGQPTVTEGSFGTLVASPLRKELGIVTRQKSEREQMPAASRPRPRGGAKARQAPKPTTSKNGASPEPARPLPVLEAPAPAAPRERGHLLVQLDATNLEAWLEGDRWRVSGTIGSELVAGFMRLVGAGVGVGG